ncbi:MAG: aminofutalosine synthase MqnE [Candidatus Wallbacteria bacterium]|nr:aminofutalosine synthase MqnE [Candidatus Wallbacteria bacterium]
MFENSQLKDIIEKVEAGQRLGFEDGMRLFESDELYTIGYLADRVRRQKNGRVAYFVVNRHLNPTNVCYARCTLCAFGVTKKDATAYTYSIEDAVERARETLGRESITELHIVGGMNASLPWTYYTGLLTALKQAFPQLHLKAYTAVEIAWLARLTGKGIEGTLELLRAAGLDSLPGGGAEIFADEVREKICDHKIGADDWLAVHRAAHKMGLVSNATMLYGHVEEPRHRVDHLLRLRALQDETGGFQAFIPLAFHPENTQLANLPGPTGFDDLRTLAISRLLLDNFPHIKAYWIQIGMKLAQVALHFGADDIDGTIVDEKITHAAGATSAAGVPRDDLVGLIRQAGFIPVQRDTIYRELRRWD